MAYLGDSGYLVVWKEDTLPEEVWSEKIGQLLGVVAEKEDTLAFESSRGFIGRNWFGPFLFAARSRFLLNSC
jgi:hypothetical protein